MFRAAYWIYLPLSYHRWSSCPTYTHRGKIRSPAGLSTATDRRGRIFHLGIAGRNSFAALWLHFECTRQLVHSTSPYVRTYVCYMFMYSYTHLIRSGIIGNYYNEERKKERTVNPELHSRSGCLTLEYDVNAWCMYTCMRGPWAYLRCVTKI